MNSNILVNKARSCVNSNARLAKRVRKKDVSPTTYDLTNSFQAKDTDS